MCVCVRARACVRARPLCKCPVEHTEPSSEQTSGGGGATQAQRSVLCTHQTHQVSRHGTTRHKKRGAPRDSYAGAERSSPAAALVINSKKKEHKARRRVVGDTRASSAAHRTTRIGRKIYLLTSTGTAEGRGRAVEAYKRAARDGAHFETNTA